MENENHAENRDETEEKENWFSCLNITYIRLLHFGKKVTITGRQIDRHMDRVKSYTNQKHVMHILFSFIVACDCNLNLPVLKE